MGRAPARFRPDTGLDRAWADIKPTWAAKPTLAETRPTSNTLCRSRPNSGRSRPEFGRIWPNLGDAGPTLYNSVVEAGQVHNDFAQTGAANFTPSKMSAPSSTCTWRCLVRSGRKEHVHCLLWGIRLSRSLWPSAARRWRSAADPPFNSSTKALAKMAAERGFDKRGGLTTHPSLKGQSPPLSDLWAHTPGKTRPP